MKGGKNHKNNESTNKPNPLNAQFHIINESYMFLYNQNKNAWTFELDVRTSKENW